MSKVDRLGWTAGFCINSFGVQVGIRANDARAFAGIEEFLPPTSRVVRCRGEVEHLFSLIVHDTDSSNSNGTAPSKRPVKRFNLVYADFTRVVRSLDREETFDRFEAALQLRVAEFSPTRTFVHAGVVGWRGRAIVIPGMSFSGKTTLTSELVRRGATYYSDEYAVIDERGRVHPYAKPLSMREGDSWKQTKRPVETFGGRAGTKPLPAGLIVISEYKSGATWRPRPLTLGQGALAMFANTVSARRQPEAALAALQKAVAGASVIKGRRGEAGAAADAILKFMDE